MRAAERRRWPWVENPFAALRSRSQFIHCACSRTNPWALCFDKSRSMGLGFGLTQRYGSQGFAPFELRRSRGDRTNRPTGEVAAECGKPWYPD